MAWAIGQTYFSLLREDRVRTAYTTYSPNFRVLDAGVAPFHLQMRVLVNNTEYSFLDPKSLDAAPTTTFTVAPESIATGGAACWGVRFQFDCVGASDEAQTAGLQVWDGDDNLMADTDLSWSVMDEFSLSGGDALDSDNISVGAFDLVATTGWNTGSANPVIASMRFPEKRTVSKIGWARPRTGVSNVNDFIQNMEVFLNVGMSHNEPEWVSMGSNLTQAVGNSQDTHAAGDAMDSVDYPTLTNPMLPDTEFLTLTVPTANHGGVLPCVVTIDPAPVEDYDRVTIFRETRQDRPWVKPHPGSYGHPELIMPYFDQIRFICMELCDLPAVANYFALGIADFNINDYSMASQVFEFDAGGSAGPFSYATLELLGTIPGAPSDDRHQIIVEQKLSDNQWVALTFDASPGNNLFYSVDSAANTITLGGTSNLDYRIRRVTRTDRWWYDPRGGIPGWNTLAIDLVQRQARMMVEEACFLPSFYVDSELTRTRFPRNWNWFVYTGTRNVWSFPNPTWGGDGTVQIWVNDTPQVDPTDYTIDGDVIRWVTPPEEDDRTVIGTGGGGGWPVTIAGDGTGDNGVTTPPADNGDNQIPDIAWPGNTIDPTFGISVSVGGKSRTAMEAGLWEGGTNIVFTQGMIIDADFNDHLLRIQITVTSANTVDDGLGGFMLVGATQIRYVGRVCAGQSGAPGAFNHAAAFKLDPNDAFSTDEGSAGLGCNSGGSAEDGPDIFALAAVSVDSFSPAFTRLVDGLDSDCTVGGGSPMAAQIPFFSSWSTLVEDSVNALTEGVVADSGFTSDQFDEFIDPEAAFTDFDIP